MTAKEQRLAFEESLKDNPLDNTTRLVFADWLEDNDQPEEADRHRKWRDSYDWMIDLAYRGGKTCLDYGGDGDDWDDITYDHLMMAGYNYIKHRDYFIQVGDNLLRNLMHEDGMVELYWNHWSVITGDKVPNTDNQIQNHPFSCTC